LMLSKISSLGDAAVSEEFLVLNRQDFIAVLERTRNHVLQRRAQRPDDLAMFRQLAQVDLQLAGCFAEQRKVEESRGLVVECLESVDRVLQDCPQDWVALRYRIKAYRVLAMVADHEGKREESVGHRERAVTYGGECVRVNPEPGLIHGLARCRRSLAELLTQQGNPERARSLILDNLRMVDEVSSVRSNPIITMWRTLVRLDLHEFQAGSSSAPAPRPDEPGPLSRLASSEAERLDAESWAELVAQCLCLRPNIDAATIQGLSWFTQSLSERIAWQRRMGGIDRAQRSTDRMHAFARLLVKRYPDQPVAHLALCESFTQRAKNAWKPFDRAVVERNWKLAIDEARRALVLDPQNARAGAQVADLQKRLDLLLASKPAALATNRSAETAEEAGR
jgi:tetratricopeptide (TPR) repeat protein